ncbi:ATG8-interacting protein 1 isoform X1 [Nicotiana tomentosiformis]|uniref:ATG8-interacting protein 1 isoform X1 n=1 Tax=Nicotiana tomentosiformis TaxID=4098 RepID=UPI00051B6FD0|nr:ATG8-interacting protein 1 isoform X1 [Nicotiana tomentosiformis]XP_033508387.1 ATG8-interacting protein 1 isoform X1 [Nicotiana tomentosiformis]XP_033508388.1 ATG8-interacting protein 1 isoform X1 [Nicotiana tomentosiformis]
MASNEEGEETAPRGNEWEVVSLTQSAYAAAPGPKQVDPNDDNNSSAEYVAETSQAMFMSGHFVFPPSQHENLPLEPDLNEICDEQGGEDAAPELVADEGGKSDIYEGSTKTKGVSTPGSHGIQFIDEKGNLLFIGAEFEEDAALQGLSLVDKEQSFLGTAKYCSYQSEEPMDLSATTEETNVHAEPVELFYQGLDSGISNLPKAKDEEDDDTSNLPCQAWWKRGAASLVAHAKDANAFWSIFIAAAVMGLVIIGQTWQQERWQVLQTKWQVVHGERIGRMFGPLSRLKDVIVGGDRRGTFIRGSAPAQL